MMRLTNSVTADFHKDSWSLARDHKFTIDGEHFCLVHDNIHVKPVWNVAVDLKTRDQTSKLDQMEIKKANGFVESHRDDVARYVDVVAWIQRCWNSVRLHPGNDLNCNSLK